MASASWSVTRRKRATTSAPTDQPKKRPRPSKRPNGNPPRQQTLTQAQWLPTHGLSFQEESTSRTPLYLTGKRNARSLSKRDSTLTQMDFFNSPAIPHADLDDAPLDVPIEDRRTHQLDGAYDSPTKSNPRKTAARHQTNLDDSAGAVDDTHEYMPPKKRMRWDDTPESPAYKKTRTSRRIAEKRAKFLSGPNSSEPVSCMHDSKPILEIQDSNASDEEIFRTPLRPRTVVLSSQSPESLPPTTKRSAQSPSGMIHLPLSPLRERSVNIPNPRTHRTPRLEKTPYSSLKSAGTPDVPTLRLPRQGAQPPRSTCEDSQGIWSLPVTSSPEKRRPPAPKLSPVHAVTRDTALPKLLREGSHEMEIPDTSQAVLDVAKSPSGSLEEVLPSPNALLGLHTTASSLFTGRKQVSAEQVAEQPLSTVVVRDFALLDTGASQRQHRPLDKYPSTPKKDVPTVIADSESEFDSPIANDTQFNAEVSRRISSPHALSEDSHHTISTEILSDATYKLKVAAARHNSDDDSADDGKAGPTVPTPRLILSSSRPPSREQEMDSDPSSEGVLPPPFLGSQMPDTHTTTVPLNDTLPSSSPLYQLNGSITQRSTVRPASMPHPSQISTQEATQYGLSSMIADDHSVTPPKAEKITIKDSSSMGMRLSQIPAHGYSQSGTSVDLGLEVLEDDGDEEELDLNPPSVDNERISAMTDDMITRHAPKRRIEQSPIHRSIKKRRRTPSRAPIAEQNSTFSLEEDFDLDPHSSHYAARRHTLNSDDANESQDFSSKANTTTKALCSAETDQKGDVEPEEVVNSPHLAPSPSQSSTSSLASSSGKPSPLRKAYPPIPGFNNETQSNFTQGGHVSAAYVHRQREKGALPQWYTPKPYKVPGYTRR